MAICRPFLAYRLCTMARTKKIIIGVWIMSVIYCCPWLALTKVRTTEDVPDSEECSFRLSPDQYKAFFLSDLFVFYLVPLVSALIVYAKIASKMDHRPENLSRTSSRVSISLQYEGSLKVHRNPRSGQTTGSFTRGGLCLRDKERAKVRHFYWKSRLRFDQTQAEVREKALNRRKLTQSVILEQFHVKSGEN